MVQSFGFVIHGYSYVMQLIAGLARDIPRYYG